MEPLYHCDFCLKLYVEDELERCVNCMEIFCINCVKTPHTLADVTYYGEDISYYCSCQCVLEDTGAVNCN
jgi:hypothetical protein